MALSDKEELELLQLQEEEYQHQKAKSASNDSNKMGVLEAAKTGYAESIPFADRIGAIAGTLGAKAGGDTRDLGDVYNEVLPQVRQQQEADIKQAREDQPLTAYGSQLFGTLAVPMPGGSVASEAAALGKLGLGKGLLAAGEAGLKQAPKFAALGGLLGASNSSDLTNVPETALNVGAGALGGALLSPVASIGGELGSRALSGAGSGIGKALGSTEFTKDILEAGKTGLQKGKLIFGKAAREEASNNIINAQKETETALQKILKETGAFKEALLKGQEGNTQVDLQPIYQEALDKIVKSNPQTGPEVAAAERLTTEIQNLMDKARSGSLEIADKQKRGLQRLSKAGQGIEAAAFPASPEASSIYKQTSSAVKDAVEAPFETARGNELRSTNARYAAGKEAEEILPSIAEASKLEKDFNPALASKIKDFEQKFNEAESFIQKAEREAAGDPGAISRLKQAAEEYNRVRRLARGGVGSVEQVAGALSTLPAKITSILGVVGNKVGKVISPIARAAGATAKEVIPSRFQKLQQWSNELEAKGLSGIPDIAQEASKSDTAKKAAMIFSASQASSKFRNLTKDEE